MRQMSPTLCPAALKNLAAAHSTLASEEAVLALALSLRRLVLSSTRPMSGMHHYWGKRGGQGRGKGG